MNPIPSAAVPTESTGGPQPVSFTCAALDDIEPRAAAISYWFRAVEAGAAYPVTIRFAGRRLGLAGKPGPHDSFTRFERVNRVIPGSGWICVTTRAEGVAAGQWQITAGPANDPREPGLPRGWANTSTRLNLPRGTTTTQTLFAPVSRVLAPGARLGMWPGLVMTGVIVGLVLQAALAARVGLHVADTMVTSIAGSLLGLVGAKLWFLVLHRRHPRSFLTAGMCIQGFVVAVIATLVAGAAVTGQNLGLIVDASAPALLTAMGIGRIGCFFGGCCAGRPTAARWGLWSSDRRLGMRRIPVQLIESSLAFLTAGAALVAVLLGPPKPYGATFIASVATYTGLRQLLFPLRDQGRLTTRGRSITLAVCGVLFLVATAAAVA